MLLILACADTEADTDTEAASEAVGADDAYAEAEAVACTFRENGAGIGTYAAMSLASVGYGDRRECAATDTELTAELQYRGSDDWVWAEVTIQCQLGDSAEDEAVREFLFQTAAFDGEACRAWLWPI